MKYLKKFENIDWMNDIVQQDLGELSSVSDEYYIMNLKDVDFIKDQKILHVEFIEKEDDSFNGTGTFKYIPSGVEGLVGDITPIKLNGILRDVFEDDPEPIIDFLFKIIKDISL